MSDTQGVRDEIARQLGWTCRKTNESFTGEMWKDPATGDEHYIHDIHDAIDLAIDIIDGGGWKWERRVNGSSGTISVWSPKMFPIFDITETGNLRLDFFTAALAKIKSQKG
jgi:hypothetical protein